MAVASNEGAQRGAAVAVLIVGSGTAGLTLAAQLAQLCDVTTRIIEQKPRSLQIGQADGEPCTDVPLRAVRAGD